MLQKQSQETFYQNFQTINLAKVDKGMSLLTCAALNLFLK